jgi:DNA-binding transcriptional regulator YiaG
MARQAPAQLAHKARQAMKAKAKDVSGAQIAEWRDRLKLSQAELAALLGTDQQQIRNIELGKIAEGSIKSWPGAHDARNH